MNKDFASFQKHFRQYQKRFGLGGYSVYFAQEPLESFAKISCNQSRMVVRVSLNNTLPPEYKPFKNIKHSAKHEAIHLLLERIEGCIKDRYISEGETTEAIEELVNKLADLIPG